MFNFFIIFFLIIDIILVTIMFLLLAYARGGDERSVRREAERHVKRFCAQHKDMVEKVDRVFDELDRLPEMKEEKATAVFEILFIAKGTPFNVSKRDDFSSARDATILMNGQEKKAFELLYDSEYLQYYEDPKIMIIISQKGGALICLRGNNKLIPVFLARKYTSVEDDISYADEPYSLEIFREGNWIDYIHKDVYNSLKRSSEVKAEKDQEVWFGPLNMEDI